jgi:4a-hydroxytetrahydrobiopterin dehydratase
MDQGLTRRGISEAVGEQGWRLLLGRLRTSVPVGSLAEAAEVAARAAVACGADADGHLRADLRADRVGLTLQTLALSRVTGRDVDLAHRVTEAVPQTSPRLLQVVEIGVDALDIPAVRPFWKALLAYADEPGGDAEDSIVDPAGQSPAVWFQQMDEPRPQRNRIHLDVCVPHDEAPHRIEAALAAGGRLLSDRRAPAFWVLADAEGNEACVTTWQGRDPV